MEGGYQPLWNEVKIIDTLEDKTSERISIYVRL